MAKKIRGGDGKLYKQHKPVYKRIWFWLLVIVVIGIVYNLGNSSTKTKNKTDAPKTETKETASSKPTDKSKATKDSESEPKTKEFNIGELVTVGEVDYTVNSFETAANVGGDYGRNAQGIYLVINVTVTNKGNEALTVLDSYFNLKDGEKEYKSDSTAGIYANQSGQSSFINEINPDNSLSSNVVFDVNQTVADSVNKQLQVQTGAWGTEKALINLK